MSFIGDLNIEISRLRSDLAVMTKLRDNAEADLRLQEQAHSGQQRATVRALEELAVARWTLGFIAENGGETMQTECGELKCTGSWCAEQASAALDAAKEDKP